MEVIGRVIRSHEQDGMTVIDELHVWAIVPRCRCWNPARAHDADCALTRAKDRQRLERLRELYRAGEP